MEIIVTKTETIAKWLLNSYAHIYTPYTYSGYSFIVIFVIKSTESKLLSESYLLSLT